jgi:hypothetical protein
MTARLPERVSYNIPLFIHAICLYWATGFHNLPAAIIRPDRLNVVLAPPWRAKALRLAALALVDIWAVLYLVCLAEWTLGMWSVNTYNRNLERISHQILMPIRALMPAHKTPILIAMPFDSVLERCIFFNHSAEKAPFFLVPHGWITHSPLFNQILERHRLRPYSLSLVDRQDVFFLMNARRWLEPLRIFYREHYGLDIRFDMVLNTDRMPQYEDCRLYLFQAHAAGDKTPIRADP